MKKGYWVVVYRSISDEAAVKAYAAAAGPAKVPALAGSFGNPLWLFCSLGRSVDTRVGSWRSALRELV